MKKNYNGLILSIIMLLIASIGYQCQAQESDLNVKIIATKFDGGHMNELGEYLLNMDMDLGIGNGCDDDFRIITTVPGDMNMNGHSLQLLNAHITVDGELTNEGTITFLCDNAILEFSNTLSTPKPERKLKFKVYPNPAYDFVNVNGNGITRIKFIDINGKVLKDYITTTKRNRIAISNLNAGMYIIQVTTEYNRLETFKLIKQ